MNNRASLQLGGDNWAAKDANLLAYKTSLSEKNFLPIEFDFERGFNLAATRVDDNGLIEKGRENLLKYSEEFDNPYYLKLLGTLTTNQTTAPDGSLTADLFTKTSGVDTVSGLRANSVYSSTGIFTFSIYVKQNVGDGVLLRLDAAGNTANASFQFSTKSISTQGSNVIDATATELANGWFRLSLTGNVTNPYWGLSIVNLFGNPTNDSIFVWGAQLEQGLVATDYIETGATTAQAGVLEDLPRINYSGGTPSLLLEPSRTNLIDHSEYFGGYSNTYSTNEVNATISPEGLTNATFFKEDTSTGSHILNKSAIVVAGVYTASVFVKANGRDWIFLNIAPASNYGAYFDLSNGTTGTILSNITSATIEDYGNGWYRCSITADTATDSLSPRIAMYLALSNNQVSYTGDGTSGVYIFGAQLEAGSYPTSYIPTYGAIATRGEDDVDQNSSDTFGSGAFSLFFEHEPIPTGFNGQVMLLSVNPLDFYFRYINDNLINIWNQDAQQAILNTNIGRNANHKICMVYDGAGTTDIYIDGVKKTNGYSYTWPDGPYRILLNTTAIVSGDIPVHISQVMTFETALTNAECITLTTL